MKPGKEETGRTQKARRAARKKNERAIEKSTRKVSKQERQAAKRAKYGPSRMPAPVIVRSLETGEVLEVRDPVRRAKSSRSMVRKIEQARYKEERRRELEEKAAWLDESLDLRLDLER